MVFVETEMEIFGVLFSMNMVETKLKVFDTVCHEKEKRSCNIMFGLP